MHLKFFLRDEHFNGMAMFMLILSLAWDYFYFNDYIVTWYGAAPVDVALRTVLERGVCALLVYHAGV